MVHGYHLIWGTYGFWLPNDPRGSWSDFVYAWELARFGPATKSFGRIDIAPDQFAIWRNAARKKLKYSAVTLTGMQALQASLGFANFASKSRLNIWAYSILPEHVHFIVGRHRYKMERVANLLKGAATRQLVEHKMHPMLSYQTSRQRLPSMWGEGQWIAYLNSEIEIEDAIRYVENNPVREGKPRQRWSLVQPYSGIEKGGWMTYH